MLNLNKKKMSFTLPQLDFSYDALEPHIDARTMEIHHSKHHQGYTNKLNSALESADLAFDSIEDLLAKIDMKNMALRNNAGGFYNHKLFWEIMTVQTVKCHQSLMMQSKNLLVLFKSLKVNFQVQLHQDLVLDGLGYVSRMEN